MEIHRQNERCEISVQKEGNGKSPHGFAHRSETFNIRKIFHHRELYTIHICVKVKGYDSTYLNPYLVIKRKEVKRRENWRRIYGRIFSGGI